MVRTIKADTIERAYAIGKRYAIIAKKVDCGTTAGRNKHDAIRSKMHDAVWRTFYCSSEWLMLPTTLLHGLIIAAIDNGKGKDAVFTALTAVGYEIN